MSEGLTRGIIPNITMSRILSYSFFSISFFYTIPQQNGMFDVSDDWSRVDDVDDDDDINVDDDDDDDDNDDSDVDNDRTPSPPSIISCFNQKDS